MCFGRNEACGLVTKERKIIPHLEVVRWFFLCRCLHRVLPRNLWWEMRIAATSGHILKHTLFWLNLNTLGIFRCKEMSFFQPTTTLATNVSRASESISWYHTHTILAMNMCSKPDGINGNPGTGRYGQNMWFDSEGGLAPQRKTGVSQKGRSSSSGVS